VSETKTISGWLVVDWKDETHRTRKSKPSASELGANELLAKLAIDVSVPEVDVPTLAVDIDVPEPQVYAATLDALDEEDLPDWSDEAAAVVDNEELKISNAANDQEFGDVVDELTAKVLLRVETRPNPANVREYVERLSRAVYEDGDAS
jgi:hypothetical protein